MAVAPTVLLCDHAPGYRMMLAAVLEDAGFDVSVCETWPEAVQCAAEHRPDAVVAALWMPTFEPELLQRVHEVSPHSVIVGVSTDAVEAAWRAVDGIGGIAAIVARHDRLDVIVTALSGALPDAVPERHAAHHDDRPRESSLSRRLAIAPWLAAALLDGPPWANLLAGL